MCGSEHKMIIPAELLSVQSGSSCFDMNDGGSNPRWSQPAVSHFMAGAGPGRGPYVTPAREQQPNEGPSSGAAAQHCSCSRPVARPVIRLAVKWAWPHTWPAVCGIKGGSLRVIGKMSNSNCSRKQQIFHNYPSNSLQTLQSICQDL